MRRRKRIRTVVLDAGLPEDALAIGARVTLIAMHSVLVEGQQGVVELSASRIRLRTRQGVVSLLGKNLCLKKLSLDAALVTGELVETVTYGRVTGV